MNSVTTIPTEKAQDAVALERLVNGLVERHRAGNIRSAIVVYFDTEERPHTCYANTTIADESYATHLLQERVMRLCKD